MTNKTWIDKKNKEYYHIEKETVRLNQYFLNSKKVQQKSYQIKFEY